MPPKTQFRFEKLTEWQTARRLGGEVCTAPQAFPEDELFGLTGQLHRSRRTVRSMTPFPWHSTA